MRKRKGFTLVELLAVIAILAILILLALPAVLRMFRNARMQSFENEVKSIYRQAQNQIISDSLNLDAGGEKVYASDITTNTATQGNLELQSGDKIKYCVLVDNEGNIKKLYVSNGTYHYISEDVGELNNIENIKIEDIGGEDVISGIENCIPTVADSSVLKYTILNNQVTINGFLDNITNKPRNLSIPSEIEGYPVTTIKNSAFSNGGLIGVIIPDSVTSIGKAAFYGNKLVNLTIPNSNLTIGYGAFNDNLLPDNQAFIYKRTSSGIDYTTIVGYGGANKNVTVPDGVQTIANQSFQQCKLVSVIIPDSVRTIGRQAFISNELISVSLGNGVTHIDELAFQNNKITSIVIPSSMTKIEGQAFYKNQLTSVTLPNTITSIEQSAFAGNKISSLTIPSSLKTIGRWAFMDNELTSLTIPNTVTSIQGAAFNNNKLSDEEAFIYRRTDTNNDGVAEIDYTTVVSYAGENRNNIQIPDNITHIGDRSFNGIGLTDIVIPSNVVSIGSYGFWSNQLTSVTIEGKTSTSDFSTFDSNQQWGWAENVTCVKNNTSNVTNGCITWSGSN